MVDVYGKCKYINMPYMDPVTFAWDTILNPNMNLVSTIEDIIESNFELNSRYLCVRSILSVLDFLKLIFHLGEYND